MIWYFTAQHNSIRSMLRVLEIYNFGWFAKEIQDDNLAAPTSFFSCYVRCIRPLVNNDGQLFFCFVSAFKNIGKTFLSPKKFKALHKLLPHWRTSKRYELFLQLLHHPRDTLFLTLGYLINLPYAGHYNPTNDAKPF